MMDLVGQTESLIFLCTVYDGCDGVLSVGQG